MNICLISKEYPPETGGGGIGTHVQAVGRELARRGHTIVVLSSTLERQPSYCSRDGIHLYRIPLPTQYGFFNQLVHALHVRSKALAIVREHQIQVVEAPEYDGESVFLELFRCPVPIVVRLQAGTYMINRTVGKVPKHPVAILATIMEWLAIWRADAITAPTQSMAAASRSMLRLPERPIQILPNAAEPPLYLRRTERPANAPLRILFVGRLERRKSPDLLAAAIPDILRRFPDTIFTFIGDDIPQGPGKSSMRRYCEALIGADLLDHVEFLGRQPHEVVEEYLARSDLFVLPSKFESFGIAYAEAMLYGLPVIACRGAGVEEVVPEGIAGSYVPQESTEALRDAILQLLGDPLLRQKMGQAGEEFALQHYTASCVAEAHETFYRGLLISENVS